MTFSAVFAIIAIASSTAPELCRGVESGIEPDVRILQSDLSQSEANSAAEKLKNMIARGELTGEFQFGALNQLKILHGHVLLRQAMTAREESGSDSVEAREATRALCTWLSTEGFWYD